eukprot:4830099-Amphidinium_carterae.1
MTCPETLRPLPVGAKFDDPMPMASCTGAGCFVSPYQPPFIETWLYEGVPLGRAMPLEIPPAGISPTWSMEAEGSFYVTWLEQVATGGFRNYTSIADEHAN